MTKLRELVTNGIVTPQKDKIETNQQTLHDKEINALFNKFSYPMVKSCISDAQRERARGISRILWMLLVSNTDSENNVYNALSEIFPNKPEDNIPVGSLYFHKMKKSLTSKEQLKLRRHYSDQNNFCA